MTYREGRVARITVADVAAKLAVWHSVYAASRLAELRARGLR